MNSFNMKAQHTVYTVGILLLCCIASVNAATPLWLLFVNSRCDGENFESSSVFPAVEMAVERINGNPSLLPGYSLNLTVSQQVCLTLFSDYDLRSRIAEQPACSSRCERTTCNSPIARSLAVYENSLTAPTVVDACMIGVFTNAWCGHCYIPYACMLGEL